MANCSTHHASAAASTRCETDWDPHPPQSANRSSQRSCSTRRSVGSLPPATFPARRAPSRQAPRAPSGRLSIERKWISLQEAEGGRARILSASPTVSTVKACLDARTVGHASRASNTTAARRAGATTDPNPGDPQTIATTALRLSVFSGKPTTKNASPAWEPEARRDADMSFGDGVQTEPMSKPTRFPYGDARSDEVPRGPRRLA